MKRFEEFALIAGSPHVDDDFARLLTDPSSFTEDVRETINGMPERYRATYLCPMLIEDPAALEASDKIAAHYGLPPLRLSPKADARMWLRGAFRDMLHWNAELRTLLNEAGPQGERRNECIGRLEEVLKKKGLLVFATEFLNMRDAYKTDPPEPVLTDEQMKVLEPLSPGERMIIVAGPGAGKTFTLKALMENLIYEQGIDPSETTVLSFTRTAALELRGRFMAGNAQLGRHVPRISTVDSLALSIVRTYAPDLLPKKLKPRSAWIDNEAGSCILQGDDMADPIWEKVVDRLVEEGITDADRRNLVLSDLKSSVNEARQKNWSPKAVFKIVNIRHVNEQELKRGAEIFAEIKARMDVVDFTDIRNLALKAMENPDTLKKVQKACRVMVMDEYQDSSTLQDLLVERMTPPDGIRIFAGDDKQTLYVDMGAEINKMREEAAKPNTRTVMIEEVKRFDNSNIAAAAQKYSENALPDSIDTKFRLPKSVKEGPKPQLIMCERNTSTSDGESVWDNEFRTHFSIIAERLEKAGSEEERMKIASSTALLCRTNEQVARAKKMLLTLPEYSDLAKYLARPQKKSRNVLKVRTPETETAASLLTSLGDTGSEADFRNLIEAVSRFTGEPVPNPWQDTDGRLAPTWDRDADESCIDAYSRWVQRQGMENGAAIVFMDAYSQAQEKGAAADALKDFLTAYPSLGNDSFHDLLSMLSENAVPADGWSSFRDDSIATGRVAANSTGEGFRIITMHASKGREWDYVHTMGLGKADDLAAKLTPANCPPEIFEENNEAESMVEYVACTRAKKEVYMTGSDTRGLFNDRTAYYEDTVERKCAVPFKEPDEKQKNKKGQKQPKMPIIPESARVTIESDIYNTSGIIIKDTDRRRIAPTGAISSPMAKAEEQSLEQDAGKRPKQPKAEDLLGHRPVKKGKTMC